MQIHRVIGGRGRAHVSLVLAVICLSAAGCASVTTNVNDLIGQLPPGLRFSSVYRDVSGFLEKGDFPKALQRLNDAGAGTITSAEKLRDRDVDAARKLYEREAIKKFVGESKELIAAGKPRSALKLLSEGLGHCAWCADIPEARRSTENIVAGLDSLAASLDAVAKKGRSDSLTSERIVLEAAVSQRDMLNDSPVIQTAVASIQQFVARTWEARIRSAAPDEAEIARFVQDLRLLEVSPYSRDRLAAQLRLGILDKNVLVRDVQHRQTLLLFAQERAAVVPNFALRLRQAIGARLSAHVMEGLSAELTKPDVDYAQLVFAEELLHSLQGRAPPTLREVIAQGHLSRAERLSGSGRTAALAMLHLERAKALGFESNKATGLEASARASFAAAGRWLMRIRIETNPADEPIVQDLARFTVLRSIRQRVRAHVAVESVSPYEKNADLHIVLTSAKLYVPSSADLSAVSSAYLSHYEDVPNPVKSALKTQLDFQRISAESALNSLNMAISTFNINPTQWGLQNVNYARTRYNIEVDNYNNTVAIYNATSSTVSRPVYLPYSFRHGTVRHGWKIYGSVRVKQIEERFTIDEVDSDFVRIGTRPQDRQVEHRRDDVLDIPVGTERLSQQLVKVGDAIQQQVAKASGELMPSVRADLSTDERQLLAAALHPFLPGGQTRSGSWAGGILTKVNLPSITPRVAPRLKLRRPGERRPGTTEEFAALYGPAVALISSKDGSHGSGAVISPDGLVLTAAHVLGTELYEVVFPRSGSSRHHSATVIFVNELRDVALLRLNDYQSDRWIEVALTENVAAGEPVIAIGNPSLGRAGTALTALSSGIIAKPYDPERKEGLPDLVADIAVASGSSGGPLISRRTGKLVGVVTAVVAPSIKGDFASSGYWAVAAPSSELGRWLGLTY